MISKRLADCQRVIGYHFADPLQLEIALTHSSVRTPDRECNERLEFLGDSVLGLAITDELYRRLPDQQEGELTRIKSAVVSRGALYRASTRMGLVRFIEVAKGVGRREELPVSLTANLVESIIGAIYLDAGFFPAREFILRHLGPELEDVLNDRVAKNYKSLLQHEAPGTDAASRPIYRTIEEEGPDHRRNFVVAAVLRGTEYGRAAGINKKEAEQEAARHALEALQRSGRGRRRRNDGRGDGRPEPRAGESRPGDARAADAGPRRDRPFGADVERPGQDEAAWRSWAEKEKGGAPGAPSAPSAPSGPYSIGPEADDGWDERSAPVPSGADTPSSPVDAPLPGGRADSLAPASTAPEVAPSSEATDDADVRGRRRRRGGRGRGRAASLDADAGGGLPSDADAAGAPAPRSRGARRPSGSSVETPVEAPRDALLSDVFAEPAAAPPPTKSAVPSAEEPAARERVRRPSTRKPVVREPAPAPADAVEPALPAEPVAEERPRRAARTPSPRAPKAGRTPTEAKPSPIQKAPAAKADVGFGAGVDPVPTIPTPVIEREVTVVGKVEAVKPVPKIPRPAPPSGFGDGL